MSQDAQNIDFSDYKIFDEASSDVQTLHNDLTEQKNKILGAKKIICSPDVFLGPIADSCKEALDILDTRVLASLDNFDSISHYFQEVSDAYKNSDEKASKLILSKNDQGKIITAMAGLTGANNEEKIFNYLKAQGLSDAAVCGIMACMYHESRFIPDITSPTEPSYGICQWYAERWTALKNYCAKNGKDPADLEAQLDFLVYECGGNYKAAWSKMNSLGNSEKESALAADSWLVYYEGISRSAKAYPGYTSDRQAKAIELYRRYHK